MTSDIRDFRNNTDKIESSHPSQKMIIDFAYFREAINIEEVADLLGIETDKNGAFLCPSHNDQNHASAKMKPMCNTWRCFTCNAGGSAIDLVMAVRGGNAKDACLFLEKYFPGGIKYLQPEEDKEDYPEIPISIMKLIGMKRNPYMENVIRDKQSGINQAMSYQISKIEATNLLLDKMLNYQQNMENFYRTILSQYPALDKQAKEYLFTETKRKKQIVEPYIQMLRDYNIECTTSKDMNSMTPWLDKEA